MKKVKLKKVFLKKDPSSTKPLPEKEESYKSVSSLLGIPVILLLGIIIYSNSFNCSFHFDDFPNIVDNFKLPELMDFKAWSRFSKDRIIPFYSFALNIHFNGMNVWGFHLINLMIHLVNSCLVWWLSLLIFNTPVMKVHRLSAYKYEFACFTALLFVSHPLATQSVTYIVQRMTSMAALFYFLSIALYIKARMTEQMKLRKIAMFTGVFLFALCAFFTKQNTFTLPFAILLIECFFIRTNSFDLNFRNNRLIFLLLGFIGFIIFLISRFSFSIFNTILPEDNQAYTLTPITYLLTQFGVIVKYIRLLILPINQMVDYDIPIASQFFNISTLSSFLLLMGLIVLAFFIFNRNRMISFGIFWYFLTLSVESSIIPIRDVMFEHRTYLPSFGYFIILCFLVYQFVREKNKIFTFGILSLLIVVNSFLTYQRNKVWKDEFSLLNDNVRKAPNLARPVNNRGSYYSNLKQWDKAKADFSKAISINPNYAKAYFNRGIVFANLLDWDSAILDYTKALKNDSLYFKAYLNRGIAYANVQQWDKAVSDYTDAIKLNPKYSYLYINRATAFMNLKIWNKAFSDFATAIQINPNNADAYSSRGIGYSERGEWDKAIEDYTNAIRLNPNHKDAYYNRGIAYRNLSEWKHAIEDYTKVIQINPKYKEAFLRRGFAYGELGQWDKAYEDYDKAVQIDPNFTMAITNRDFAFKNLNKSKK